jgi:hypothetical protein
MLNGFERDASKWDSALALALYNFDDDEDDDDDDDLKVIERAKRQKPFKQSKVKAS